MKKLTLSIIVALAFCVTAAVAQTSGSSGYGSQGTQQSSPGMQPGTQQTGAQQPGMGQSETNPPMNQENKQNNTSGAKGERKLKGCVQSQGGQYVLETKKGKDVVLSGQDVSAHVGHEVAVKGSWEQGGNAGMSPSSSGSSAGSEKTFNVSSVEMISENCGGKSSKGSSGSTMGTTPGGTSPSGTGSNPNSTGSTPPPQ